MADLMKDMDELDAINTEREGKNLPPFGDIAEARLWKSMQAAVETKTDEVKADGEAKPDAATETQTQAEPVKFTAPVAKRAEVKADDGELAAAKAEIQRLKSEAGRSTVLANEMRDLKAKVEAAEARANEAERKAQELADKASEGDLMAGLTQEEREALNDNPKAVSAIAAIAKKFMSKGASASDSGVTELRERIDARERAESERAERDRMARAEEMWSKQVATVVPPEVYGQFASHPKWDEWCAKTYAGEYNADLYNKAVDSVDGDAVIDQLQRFMRYAGITVPTKGQKPPLRVDEVRGGQVATGSQPEAFYAEDVQRIEDDFAQGRLPSGWTSNQFTAWAKRVDDARYEGRIKPGRAPR